MAVRGGADSWQLSRQASLSSPCVKRSGFLCPFSRAIPSRARTKTSSWASPVHARSLRSEKVIGSVARGTFLVVGCGWVGWPGIFSAWWTMSRYSLHIGSSSCAASFVNAVWQSVPSHESSRSFSTPALFSLPAMAIGSSRCAEVRERRVAREEAPAHPGEAAALPGGLAPRRQRQLPQPTPF